MMNSRVLSDSSLIIIEGEGVPTESSLHAFLSVSVTLTLGILGSSVLPVPFAFSRSGVLLGLLVSLLVGFANSLTGTLLLRAAGHLEEHTFEALAGKAAGRFWKVVTEVSMVLLLFGTLCGDYALLADCGKRALLGLFPDHPPWMTAGDGRVPMVALGLLIVFPLSCMKRIRSLEYAAMAGVGLVLVLAGVIMHSAISAGFPAVRSGELPLAKVSLSADLPEAVAVLSFAFYVQPMLLPLLKEMPPGRLGVNLTCKAVQLVTMVIAFLVYGVVGVFAAARYGLKTEGDILVNQWLPGRWDGALDGLVAIYLSLSMVPMVMTMRYQLNSLVTGQYPPYLFRRELALTVFSLLTSLAVALKWPTAAEKMFAVTGASAVCLVCYVIPVVIHLSLYFKSQQRKQFTGSLANNHRLSHAASSRGPTDAQVHLVVKAERTAVGAPAGPAHESGDAGSSPTTYRSAIAEELAGGALEAGRYSKVTALGTTALPVNHIAGELGNISFDNWLPAQGGGCLGGSPVYDPSACSPPYIGRGSHSMETSQSEGQAGLGGAGWHPRNAVVEALPTSSAAGLLAHRYKWQHGASVDQSAGHWVSDRSLEEPLLEYSNGQVAEGSSGMVENVQFYPSVCDLEGQTRLRQVLLVARHVILPVLIMLVGTAFSFGALWLSVAELIR